VASPLETIINTVTGLKGFALAGATPLMRAEIANLKIKTDSLKTLSAPPPDWSDAETRVGTLSTEIQKLANDAAAKQTKWQQSYQEDLTTITNYSLTDYRGTNWQNFNPKTGLASIHAQAAVTDPKIPADLKKINMNEPPSELDYAQIQADVDVIKMIQSRFTARCSSATDIAGAAACNNDAASALTASADEASAILSILQDNFKILQAAQTAVTSSVAALDKIYADFIFRRDTAHTIAIDKNVIVQQMTLPSDYGATDTGTISCATDTTPAVATTDTLNYSILFQNVPALSVTAGLLTTFLQMKVYGVTQQVNNATTPPSTSTVFAVTNSARASVFPMAFVNFRTGRPALRTWWGEPFNELVIANHISTGIGINPNTGTSQVEFFVGDAVSFSRVFIHAGAHFGRQESLGGGFSLGTVPSTFTGTTAPIRWSYQPAFSIGLSVRIAPF
jgi:hypothetical protein